MFLLKEELGESENALEIQRKNQKKRWRESEKLIGRVRKSRRASQKNTQGESERDKGRVRKLRPGGVWPGEGCNSRGVRGCGSRVEPF